MKTNVLLLLSFFFYIGHVNSLSAQERGALDLTPQHLINDRYVSNENLNIDEGCTQSMDFLKSFYKQLKYPASARDKGIGGQVVLSILVDELGKHSNPEIVKDIGEECGLRALEVCNNVINMCETPVTLDGKAVKAKIFLPINFKLE